MTPNISYSLLQMIAFGYQVSIGKNFYPSDFENIIFSIIWPKYFTFVSKCACIIEGKMLLHNMFAVMVS
jgi:hypothetical protein